VALLSASQFFRSSHRLLDGEARGGAVHTRAPPCRAAQRRAGAGGQWLRAPALQGCGHAPRSVRSPTKRLGTRNRWPSGKGVLEEGKVTALKAWAALHSLHLSVLPHACQQWCHRCHVMGAKVHVDSSSPLGRAKTRWTV